MSSYDLVSVAHMAPSFAMVRGQRRRQKRPRRQKRLPYRWVGMHLKLSNER